MLVCVLAPALLWIGSTRLAAVCSGHGQEFVKATQVEWLLAAPDLGVKKPWSEVGGRTGVGPLAVTRISLGRPDISLAAVAELAVAPEPRPRAAAQVGVVELRI